MLPHKSPHFIYLDINMYSYAPTYVSSYDVVYPHCVANTFACDYLRLLLGFHTPFICGYYTTRVAHPQSNKPLTKRKQTSTKGICY